MNPRILPADDRPEAVLAGTLSLMSCYAQHPLPLYAERIAGNLVRMTQLVTLSPELRSICGRLSARWHALQGDANARTHDGHGVSDARALH